MAAPDRDLRRPVRRGRPSTPTQDYEEPRASRQAREGEAVGRDRRAGLPGCGRHLCDFDVDARKGATQRRRSIAKRKPTE